MVPFGVHGHIFLKGGREDPGNYRGITLLSVLRKVVCNILHNRLVQCLGALPEGHVGYMHNMYTLSEIVQGRLRKHTVE